MTWVLGMPATGVSSIGFPTRALGDNGLLCPVSSVCHPLVSVVLPVRDEGAFIEETLRAVLAQDYPRERMEIIVADGMSEDGTREIVRELAETDSRLRMVDNPKQITPAGLNLAIRESRGEVIVRVDGHGVVPPNYVRECVAYLTQTQTGSPVRLNAPRPSDGRGIKGEGNGRGQGEVSNPSSPSLTPNLNPPSANRVSDSSLILHPSSFTPPPPSGLLVVGGAWDSVGRGFMGEAIAVAMSSKFGVGNSPYRILEAGGVAFQTDTVPFWAIHRRTFERVGLFREELVCHEDYEFNHRLRSAGGAVVLLPWLRAEYYVRSTLGELARQYWRYGTWKGRFLRSQPGSLKLRHLIPPLFVAALVVAAIAALFDGAGRIACWILVVAYLCFLLIATVTLFLTHRRDHQSEDSSNRQSPIVNRKSEIRLSSPLAREMASPNSQGCLPPSALRPLPFARFALLPVILGTLHLCWGAGVWVGLMRGKVPGEPPAFSSASPDNR